MSDGPSKCTNCGGGLDYGREYVHTMRQGNDVALVHVRADVCTQCGEALLPPAASAKIERAWRLFREGGLHATVGRVYEYRDEAELPHEEAAE
jgi:YgiT-type zinc finger domain-containing protein